MKRKLTVILAFIGIALCFAAPSSCEDVTDLAEILKIRVDRPDGIYAKGDTVRVYADVDQVPSRMVEMNIFKFGIRDSSLVKGTLLLKEGVNLIFERRFDEPVWVMVSLYARQSAELNAGFLVAPDEFTPGFEEPEDFLGFWEEEVSKMRGLEFVSTVEALPVETADADSIEAFSVQVNCVGPRPVCGIVARPKGAAEGTLPLVLFFHSAGCGPGNQSHVHTAVDFARYGALAIDVNAHGMLNGQDDEYYRKLAGGELKGYSNRMPTSRDDYYYKWMFLRAQRALDYMTEDSLWDGKHILVVGTSQGGHQSAFLAGIEPRVTTAVLVVPSGIDMGGYLKGRLPGTPHLAYNNPDSVAPQVCPYFDAAFALKYTKADVWCEIGLYDVLCPPSSVFSGLNAVKGNKVIHTFQRNHVTDKHNRDAYHPIILEQIRYTREQLFK